LNTDVRNDLLQTLGGELPACGELHDNDRFDGTGVSVARCAWWRRRRFSGHIDESWRPSYFAAKRAFIDEAPFPDRMPYFGAVQIDELDRIWIAHYLPSHQEGARATQWMILGVDGNAVATMETPARFRVMQAGDDWLLGVAHDEDDVEEVQLLRFNAGG
jgi:hypothetical protein